MTDIDGNEIGKLFVGGLAQSTNHESLKIYFSSFGTVDEAIVMMDHRTGRSRGFGYVKFQDVIAVDQVLDSKPHILDGKEIDAKQCNVHMRGKSRRSMKIFVGGIPLEMDVVAVRKCFEQYGAVSEVNLMKDHTRMRHRGFAFIGFQDETVVKILIQTHYINMGGKQVEIKAMEPPNFERKSIDVVHKNKSANYSFVSGSGGSGSVCPARSADSANNEMWKTAQHSPCFGSYFSFGATPYPSNWQTAIAPWPNWQPSTPGSGYQASCDYQPVISPWPHSPISFFSNDPSASPMVHSPQLQNQQNQPWNPALVHLQQPHNSSSPTPFPIPLPPTLAFPPTLPVSGQHQHPITYQTLFQQLPSVNYVLENNNNPLVTLSAINGNWNENPPASQDMTTVTNAAAASTFLSSTESQSPEFEEGYDKDTYVNGSLPNAVGKGTGLCHAIGIPTNCDSRNNGSSVIDSGNCYNWIYNLKEMKYLEAASPEANGQSQQSPDGAAGDYSRPESSNLATYTQIQIRR